MAYIFLQVISYNLLQKEKSFNLYYFLSGKEVESEHGVKKAAWRSEETTRESGREGTDVTYLKKGKK